jgi:predicted nucleotidyltransferase
MDREQLLRRIRLALEEAFARRLKGIVLYGSEARREAAEDSDLDLLVLLNGPIEEPHDSWECIDALYPLVLESGRPIHAEPVDAKEYRAAEYPLFQHAAREGVLL